MRINRIGYDFVNVLPVYYPSINPLGLPIETPVEKPTTFVTFLEKALKRQGRNDPAYDDHRGQNFDQII